MTAVHLSRLHFPVTSLGPGRRIGLWMQGCSLGCPGCLSRDTWDPDRGATDVDAVIARVESWLPEADGLTISGGEPFDQPVALAALLSAWRARSAGSVLVFTGYEREQIQPQLDALHGLIDAVITGPFRRDLPPTRPLRGSDNQEIHILTTGGAAFSHYDRPRTAIDRKLDLMIDDDGTAWFAGIPDPGDVAALRRRLIAAGHRVQTSDQASAMAC